MSWFLFTPKQSTYNLTGAYKYNLFFKKRKKILYFFLCVIFRAFSFMIVIISPTHAQYTSLLYTLESI
jgi:hypothetical protein